MKKIIIIVALMFSAHAMANTLDIKAVNVTNLTQEGQDLVQNFKVTPAQNAEVVTLSDISSDNPNVTINPASSCIPEVTKFNDPQAQNNNQCNILVNIHSTEAGPINYHLTVTTSNAQFVETANELAEQTINVVKPVLQLTVVDPQTNLPLEDTSITAIGDANTIKLRLENVSQSISVIPDDLNIYSDGEKLDNNNFKIKNHCTGSLLGIGNSCFITLHYLPQESMTEAKPIEFQVSSTLVNSDNQGKMLASNLSQIQLLVSPNDDALFLTSDVPSDIKVALGNTLPMTFTLQNLYSNTNLKINDLVDFLKQEPFSIDTDSCSNTELVPLQKCELKVTYKPTRAEHYGKDVNYPISFKAQKTTGEELESNAIVINNTPDGLMVNTTEIEQDLNAAEKQYKIKPLTIYNNTASMFPLILGFYGDKYFTIKNQYDGKIDSPELMTDTAYYGMLFAIPRPANEEEYNDCYKYYTNDLLVEGYPFLNPKSLTGLRRFNIPANTACRLYLEHAHVPWKPAATAPAGQPRKLNMDLIISHGNTSAPIERVHYNLNLK